jgi:elongation factor Ts
MAVTLELIQQLRERTGLGMMDCKKALTETNGDIEKAIEILRKKGSLVAEKRSGNKTSQGIIHSYIHSGSQVGVLLEINCETDFVARNDAIKELAQNICMQIAALKPTCISKEEVDTDKLEKEKDVHREILKKEGKPANMIENIVEGKLKKFYAEHCLLNQSFIKDEKKTIEDIVKEVIAKVGENIKINKFSRFEIGQ